MSFIDDEYGFTNVYVDGSYQRDNRAAGYGIYWGADNNQ